jgi:hypothetical protein
MQKRKNDSDTYLLASSFPAFLPPWDQDPLLVHVAPMSSSPAPEGSFDLG